MTMEVGLTSISKVLRKKKCSKKTGSRKKPSPSSRASATSFPLQRLYMSCIDMFKGVGTVPSPTDVQKLCGILDGMKAEDVGLSSNLPFFKTPSIAGRVTPKVTCTTIYQSEKFSLCIFFLPANAVIPLHNHPGMTVFNKLLIGKVHIKAYDWVASSDQDDSISSSKPKLARLIANGVFTAPCDTSVLYPTSGGNIHTFKAITPCAVLDVMGPPYAKEDGRDCSYYRDIPYDALPLDGAVKSEDERERYWWLEEIETPKESEMEGIEYMGPRPDDHE